MSASISQIPGYRCSSCGAASLRRLSRCECGGREWQETGLAAQGSVYSHTTLYASAEAFEKDLPFQIAIIELDGGPRLTCRIEGKAVKINDRVAVRRQRNGVWFFGKSAA